MIERRREVSQGRSDDPLCLAGAESIPPLPFADKVCGADAPMVEAAVDGEGEAVVDPAILEQVRDCVVDVREDTAAGKVQDGEILRMGVVVAEEHCEREPAQEVGNRPLMPLERAEELGDPVRARATGVTRRFRVLKFGVVVHPVQAERLGGVLLVDERDCLAADNPVVGVGRPRFSDRKRRRVYQDVLNRFVTALGGTLMLIADFGDEQLKIA